MEDEDCSQTTLFNFQEVRILCESMSPRVLSQENTLGPRIQSNDQQSTQSLRQADVQVLLQVVVPHIINFVHAPPSQLSTAVHTYEIETAFCGRGRSLKVGITSCKYAVVEAS